MFWNTFDALYVPDRCMKCGRMLTACRDPYSGVIVGYCGSGVVDMDIQSRGSVLDPKWMGKHFIGYLCEDCDSWGKRKDGDTE